MARTKKNAREATKRKVKVTKNGPYLVSGGVPLLEEKMCVDADGQRHGWKEGKKYPAQQNYALCRCGHSHNKPFCDATHATIQFDGTEMAVHSPYLEQATEIIGPGLDLTDAKKLCAFARFCHRDAGVWKLTEGSGDPDARQKAIEEACDCPSGRLVAWTKEGKALEPVLEFSIGLVEDTEAGTIGPLWVRGGILIESADGTTYEIRNRVALCRCGKSANKPFCDGSHLK